MAYGKASDTPAAVVQGRFGGGTKVVRGSLLDIAEKTVQAGMKAPAVIVVGECAGMDLGVFIPVGNDLKRVYLIVSLLKEIVNPFFVLKLFVGNMENILDDVFFQTCLRGILGNNFSVIHDYKVIGKPDCLA